VASPGFSVPFWRGGLILRLIAFSVPVQPFADVIGNHTSHNRDNKTDNNVKQNLSPPFRASIGGGNRHILYYFFRFLNEVFYG